MTELFTHEARKNHLQLLVEIFRQRAIPLSPVGSINWTSVDRDLGVELPSSFKEFCDSFPAGVWGNYLTLASPVSASEEFRLNHDYLAGLHRRFSELSGVPLFPEVPGYLIFAVPTLRTHLAYRVESHGGRLVCGDSVFLLEMVAGVVEDTGIRIDEFLYRSITNTPPLPGELSRSFHEWIFKDGEMPLLSPHQGS